MCLYGIMTDYLIVDRVNGGLNEEIEGMDVDFAMRWKTVIVPALG